MMQRGLRVCSLSTDLQKEKQHLREVFTKKNGYPASFVDRALKKKKRQNEPPTLDKPIGTITIPYIKEVSERIGRILGRADIRTAFRTVTTIRSLLVKTKPATEEHNKKGVIYKVPCQDCNKVYIGETGRKFGTRLNGHKRHCRLLQPDKSAIAEHAIGKNHPHRFRPERNSSDGGQILAQKSQRSPTYKKTLEFQPGHRTCSE